MTTLMRNDRDRRSGKPANVPREERARAFGWDPISGSHQGQRPQRPRSKAVYMAAPERFAEMSDFSLAPRAPSIHGTSLHFVATQQFVRFRIEADIERVVITEPDL